MGEIKTEKTVLAVSDGTKMTAYVARPAGGAKAPGVIVFQEAFGITSHIREVTEMVAGEGYTAIAPELFHRTAAAGTELSYGDFPAVMPHMQALTREGLQADIRAAYEWLKGDASTAGDRVGCIGFCLGGRTSFMACATVPLKAAISFYGGGIGPGGNWGSQLDLVPSLHSPILFFWGGLDKHIPPEQTRPIEDALTEAGKDFVNAKISFADHGFFRKGSASYSERGAALAWALSKEFLALHVKGH